MVLPVLFLSTALPEKSQHFSDHLAIIILPLFIGV
jgi:hypothetical protein